MARNIINQLHNFELSDDLRNTSLTIPLLYLVQYDAETDDYTTNHGSWMTTTYGQWLYIIDKFAEFFDFALFNYETGRYDVCLGLPQDLFQPHEQILYALSTGNLLPVCINPAEFNKAWSAAIESSVNDYGFDAYKCPASWALTWRYGPQG